MPYAVSNNGKSWRAISPEMELLNGETYSETRPPEILPTPEELARALEMQASQAGAITGYATLPDWARIATADDTEDYINGQIWNGADIATVNAYIDVQIGTVTGTSLATALTSINAQLAGVRVVLKAAAGAIIAMRGLFVLTAKLLIYIRDLVIRWR